MLSKTIELEIKSHAILEMPEECCGLIVSDSSYPCRNMSAEPKNHFLLSPEDYLSISKKGEIKAVYHSHLENPEFSQFDMQNSEFHKLPLILYCIKTDVFSIYRPQGFQLPYLGRGYVHGKVDCLTLIRDFYSHDKNVFIEDMTHPYRFVEDKKNHPDNTKSYSILLDYFITNNFIEVKEVKKDDVLLIRTPFIPSPVHCGILRDNNTMMHHPFQGVSCLEPYSNFWKSRTVHIMRHRSLM
jgi:proteasome lid subunit RPN8/RPN11